MKPGPRPDLPAALALYAVVLVVYFLPLLTRMGDAVPGDYFIFGHLGNTIFYTPDQLSGAPCHSKARSWPEGGWCIFNAWFNIIFIAFSRWLVPLVADFNISLLLSLLFAPLAMYMLGRSLGLSPPASFVAGLVYGFPPLILSSINNGQIEQFHHGWIPLGIMFFIEIMKGRRSLRSYAGLAASFFAAVVNNGYYALFLVIFLGVLFFFSLSREAVRRGALSHGVLSLLLVAATAIYPVHYYQAMSRMPADSLFFLPAGIKDREFVVKSMGFAGAGRTQPKMFVDLANLVSPRDSSQGDYKVYLGFSLLPFLLSALFNFRRRGTGMWVFSFLLFLLLAMGPRFVVNNEIVKLAGLDIPMPYGLLHALFPEHFVFTMAYRYLIGSFLCAAVLTATEVDALMRKVPAGGRLVLAGLCSLALLLDFFLLPGLPFPARASAVHVPAFYRAMGADKDDYAIVEFPEGESTFQEKGGKNLPQFYAMYQAFHGKRMLNNPLNSFSRRFPAHPFLVACTALSCGRDARLDAAQADLAWFEDKDFRYLIVHSDSLDDRYRGSVLSFMRSSLGDPVHSGEEGLVVFSFAAREGASGRLHRIGASVSD
jgi:hypothetical protein